MNNDLKNELLIGEMYQRVMERGELLNVDDMRFLEDRLDEYAEEMMEYLETGKKPTEARSRHAHNDIQMIVSMMEKCIVLVSEEEDEDDDPNK